MYTLGSSPAPRVGQLVVNPERGDWWYVDVDGLRRVPDWPEVDRWWPGTPHSSAGRIVPITDKVWGLAIGRDITTTDGPAPVPAAAPAGGPDMFGPPIDWDEGVVELEPAKKPSGLLLLVGAVAAFMLLGRR